MPATRTRPDPALTGLDVSTYTIPTDSPEADGTFAWDATTMVVVQARAGDCEGLGWTYAPPSCAQLITGMLAPAVAGRSAWDTGGAALAMLQAVRNTGRSGLAGYAISAVDCALWDLKARLLDLPLYRLLGAARRGRHIRQRRVHDLLPPATGGPAGGWVHGQHIPRVKIKIGQDRGTTFQQYVRS